MRILTGAVVLLGALLLPALASAEGVLDRIAKSGEIRLAYRDDAAPFSWMAEGAKEPEGYSVALCRAVAKSVEATLKLADLRIRWVKVSPEDRFEVIAESKADLLCEATTVTLERRAKMDFSIATFISGAGMMILPGGPTGFDKLAGKKVGVLGGTTTEADLKTFLKGRDIAAGIVTVPSHAEGFQQLAAGKFDAYFADRTILQFMLMKNNQDGKFLLGDQFLSVEPYALAMPRDGDFRLAVDRALSRLLRSGEAKNVFRGAFGAQAQPTGLQSALFLLSGLPE
jgi:polar amino acid transport system substrate-binding protein/glutamate/aspartate transport system substrate-binding protein